MMIYVLLNIVLPSKLMEHVHHYSLLGFWHRFGFDSIGKAILLINSPYFHSKVIINIKQATKLLRQITIYDPLYLCTHNFRALLVSFFHSCPHSSLLFLILFAMIIVIVITFQNIKLDCWVQLWSTLYWGFDWNLHNITIILTNMILSMRFR